ncbi:MAG: tetratricopeptide repeat protein [Burkholderiales bacterium]|nr:tetratricopeptide repeat protein [Burkholderiales bacterium]
MLIGYCVRSLRGRFGGRAESRLSPSAASSEAGDAKPDESGRAFTYLQQGRLDEAEGIYRKILLQQPDNADALHFFGVLQAQRQNLAEAADLIDRALALDPGNATAHSNRGNVFRMQGRSEDALASYERALRLAPESVEARINHGDVLLDLGRHEAALASYDALLSLMPDHREVQIRRSLVLRALRRLEEALAGYDRALAIRADDAETLFQRGQVLGALKRHAEAVDSYDRALAIKPGSVTVLNDRGIALRHLQRRTEALASFDRALDLNPGYAEAHNNRGALLADMGRHDEALASYDRALELRPDAAGFLNNRGDLLRVMGLHERAARDYARLFELEPAFDQALGHKLHADLQICNWKNHDADRQRLFAAVRAGRSFLPFTVLVLSGSGAEPLQSARTYAAQKYPMAVRPLWTGERYRHDRIRIAYLSADFYLHATTMLMAELFERHDRGRFELSAWSFGPDVRDGMRERLQQSFEHFHDVRGISDIEVAAMLRAREIDIAVDLKGYSKGCRPAIFAQRAAPIQVNYLVYPGTMGADFIDYIIGDKDVIPEGDEIFYAEKVVRLPESYQVNGSRRVKSAQIPLRADAGLPESGFVFCCFNHNYKITPEVFAVWMRLLNRVEGSVLWLLQGNAAACRNLKREAEARGVHPERLIFAPRLPPADHMARHRLADLFLDTLPCNAHTTASDALWAGLPLLTCRGGAFPGRVAASVLRAIGLPELITGSLDEYEALAFRLATTPELLADIRSRLAQNKTTHPLFDTDRYRRHLESAYVTMYERCQQGELPRGFSVPALS